MGLWSWITGKTADNRARNSREQNEERELSPSMPAAAVGASLAARPEDSETERAARRAANHNPS
jgi:hypothetical protein